MRSKSLWGEKGRFHPSGWSLFVFFVVVALILFGARALLVRTGVEAQFVDLARQFNTQRAWDDVTYLAHPKLQGEPTNSGAIVHTANYIASQFAQAGLTDLPKEGYFQHYVALRGRVTAEPSLEILGPDGSPRVQFDWGLSFDPLQPFEVERTDCGPSCREHELVVLGNTRGAVRASGVILLLDPTEVLAGSWYGGFSPYAAILRLVPDDELWRDDHAPAFDASTHIASFPALLVGESAARQLLAEAGLDLDRLKRSLEAKERINVPTGLQVRVGAGLAYDRVATANVVGYFPAADKDTEGDRILVATSYGGPFLQEGMAYPGMDDDVSGVAVMLEAARLWQDLGFEPKRTVVFAAFNDGGGRYFVHHPIFPASVSDTWTAVVLQGVGESGPRLSRREAGGGLARAFDQSARRFGMRTEELEKWRFFFTGGAERMGYVSSDRSYSGLAVIWSGNGSPDAFTSSRPSSDPPDDLDQDPLAETGRAVAHYLMVLSSR